MISPSRAKFVDDEDQFDDVLADVALNKEEQLNKLIEKSSNFYIKNLVFRFSTHDSIFYISGPVDP